MKSFISQIKDIIKLSEPKHIYTFLTAIVKTIMFILELVEIAVAAIFIEKLTQGNFQEAYWYLFLSLAIVVFNNSINALCYYYHPVLIGHAYNNIQRKLVDKLKKITDNNFETHSKEKILNTFHRDSWIVGDFFHTLAVESARLVKVVVALASIFLINSIVGIVVIGVTILNYFIYKKLSDKYIERCKIVAKGTDTLQEKFSKIIDSRIALNELDFYHRVDKEYEKENKKFIKNVIKENMSAYLLDTAFSSYNKIIIFAISCTLVFLITQGSLTISTYLMMVGYIVTFITISNQVMGIFKSVKSVTISVTRINTILNFDEYGLIEYGKDKTDNIDGSISFKNISLNYDEKLKAGALFNISFYIKNNDTTVIYGLKNSGKRLIFYLLRRMVKPDGGMILVDNIDIFQFNEKTYHSNIAYVSYKPLFFNKSIMYNLKMVSKNENSIIKVCKTLGIHNSILKLPKKYNENIETSKHINDELKYLIALARGILTNSEIILLYEFPTSLSNDSRMRIKKVLEDLRYTKTIIIFSASEQVFDITDNIIKIERGKVKLKN